MKRGGGNRERWERDSTQNAWERALSLTSSERSKEGGAVGGIWGYRHAAGKRGGRGEGTGTSTLEFLRCQGGESEG